MADVIISRAATCIFFTATFITGGIWSDKLESNTGFLYIYQVAKAQENFKKAINNIKHLIDTQSL